METVVRIEGAVEQALENLITQGFFKTRAEVIRAGILSLAKEYGAMPSGTVNKVGGGSHAHLAIPDLAKGQKRR